MRRLIAPIFALLFLFAAPPVFAADDCHLKLVTALDLVSTEGAFFNVQIQHQPYVMGLNTGSANSMLSKPLADELHLTLKPFSTMGRRLARLANRTSRNTR